MPLNASIRSENRTVAKHLTVAAGQLGTSDGEKPMHSFGNPCCNIWYGDSAGILQIVV